MKLKKGLGKSSQAIPSFLGKAQILPSFWWSAFRAFVDIGLVEREREREREIWEFTPNTKSLLSLWSSKRLEFFLATNCFKLHFSFLFFLEWEHLQEELFLKDHNLIHLLHVILFLSNTFQIDLVPIQMLKKKNR